MNVSAAWALVAFTVRRVFAGRRTAALVSLQCAAPALAAVIAILHANGVGREPPFDEIVFHLSLHVTLILTALIYGIALTSSEMEDGTSVYLLLSASPRWLLPVVHVLATSSVLTVVATASIALTYGICMLAGSPGLHPGAIAANALVVWTACTAYLSFIVFCGGAFKHNVSLSIGAVLLWEFIVPILPFKLVAYTVTVNSRVLWMHLAQEGERARWFRNIVGFDLPTYGGAATFVSVVIAVFLTLAMVAAMNRSHAGRENS